jgi:hypothetical protein
MRWVIGIDKDFGKELIKKVTPSAFALYFILRGYADTESRCYPSIPTLAKDLDKDERTIFRNLDELEKAEVLKRVKHEGKPNTYVLIETISIREFEPLTEMSPLTDTSPTPDIPVTQTPDESVTTYNDEVLPDEVIPSKKGGDARAKTRTPPRSIEDILKAFNAVWKTDALLELYPNLNLEERYRYYCSWLRGNESKAREYKNWKRTISKWLRQDEQRAQFRKRENKVLEDAQKDSWIRELEEAHKETLASQKEEVNADGE